VKLAVIISCLSLLLASLAFAQPPSQLMIRGNIFHTDGSTKVPADLASLPAEPCISGTTVILDKTGVLPSELYVCDDRGAGLKWFEVAIDAGITNERQVPVAFSAASFEVDGTICEVPEILAITTQNAEIADHRVVSCVTKSTSGKITSSVGLGADVKASTNIDVWVQGINHGTTPAGSLDFNIWAKCEDAASDLATINFGAAQKATIEFDSVPKDRWVMSNAGTALTLVPGGTCGAYSRLTIQLKMLAGAGESDTTLSDAYVIQVLATYTSLGF